MRINELHGIMCEPESEYNLIYLGMQLTAMRF